MKVSVLTPIYNSQRYLRESLDCLAAQTMKDIEFVCVDDGSTDESLAILQEYAQNDARFMVLSKPNGGYGSAMNLALQHASGEYVAVLEPDDLVDQNAYEKLYDQARRCGFCDMVAANYLCFDDSGTTFKELYPVEMCGRVISPLDEPATVFATTMAIWAGLYRKHFLDAYGIGFLETPGASFQDTGFVTKCRCAATSVCLVHDAFVHYRTGNPEASTADTGKVNSIVDEYRSIEAFVDTLDPVRSERLLPWIASQKFRSYCWNIKRIAQEHRQGFAEAAAQEFATLDEQGLLREECFAPHQWNRLQALLVDPISLVLTTRAQELRSEGRTLAYWRTRVQRKGRLMRQGLKGVAGNRNSKAC